MFDQLRQHLTLLADEVERAMKSDKAALVGGGLYFHFAGLPSLARCMEAHES
jgi:hypothetical protein